MPTTLIYVWSLITSTYLTLFDIATSATRPCKKRKEKRKKDTSIYIPAWRWARWSSVDHSVSWCNIRFYASVRRWAMEGVLLIHFQLWWGTGARHCIIEHRWLMDLGGAANFPVAPVATWMHDLGTPLGRLKHTWSMMKEREHIYRPRVEHQLGVIHTQVQNWTPD
jgi:hypothetical protein